MPVTIVAMRLPYHLMAITQASTFICAYSILEPSMQATAKALFDQNAMTGHLPVTIPGVEMMV